MNRNLKYSVAFAASLLIPYLAYNWGKSHASAPSVSVPVADDEPRRQPTEAIVSRPYVDPISDADAETSDERNDRELVSIGNKSFKNTYAESFPSKESALSDDYPLPLSALGINPELKLSEEQLRIMRELGDEFLAGLGPSKSSYYSNSITANDAEMKRWQAAQKDNDERFRGIFGDDLFNAQQIYRAQIEQSGQGGNGS